MHLTTIPRRALPLVTWALMAAGPGLALAGTVTYTDRSAFEASLPSGFYFENFLTVPNAIDTPVTSVSGTGGTPQITATITAPPSGVGVFPDAGFKAIGNWNNSQNLVTTFDSGNVFSAGGEVWLSNIDGGRLAGNITVDFANASGVLLTAVVPSTTSGAFGYLGITTTDGPITSITLNAAAPAYLNLSNVSVAVPEPSAIALLGCAAACGGWMWRRRSRQRVV